MSFDDRKYDATPKRGDVGGVAIDASFGFEIIIAVLLRLSAESKVDISNEISELRKVSSSLDQQFVQLTGWKDDDATG